MCAHRFSAASAPLLPQAMLDHLVRLGGTLAAFGLVVVDECHHADDNHPANALLRRLYLPLPPAARPPVLGLTASLPSDLCPARAQAKCERLLANLGGAALLVAEEPGSVADMARWTVEVETVEVALGSDASQAWR
jgi:superfamily II DNA or RNA helicase